MLKKKIAIIGSGEMAVIIADEAKRMGIISHSFSNNSEDRVKGHCDFHHNVDIFDIEKIIKICKKISIDGVIATTELTVSIAAELASALGLKGIPVEVAKNVTDKGYVRNIVSSLNSIKQPNYNIFSVGDDFSKILEYPVIVKPTSMGGKRGITVVSSPSELSFAIKYAEKYMTGKNNRIIIEQFLSRGKEYSVESLSFNGIHKVIQITEKITSGPPHCVELGHMQPAEINGELADNIKSTISELLDTVGIDNTTTHTEIKIVDNEIYLIELNARSGGDHIAYPLTELSTGYSFIKAAIEISLNIFNESNIKLFNENSSGIIFITQQTSQFKELFDICEIYPWLYKKNYFSEELNETINNQAFDSNYMIYSSDTGIPREIKKILDIS